MKKYIILLTCLSLLLSLAGCAAGGGQESVPETTVGVAQTNDAITDGKTLKLLAITSSFGLNTTQFLYEIAKAEGFTDVIVARLYIGGCTLATHVKNLETNANAYQYTKNATGMWETRENVNMHYGLQDEQWDVIFLQQSAANGGLVESYGNHIDTLVSYVNENKANPDAKLVWNMTWAYQKDSRQEVFLSRFGSNQQYMYEQIVSATRQKVEPREDIAAIIPTGTAIQNARSGHFGDNLTVDTYHLNGMGKVIAGYTLFATLTGKPLTGVQLKQTSGSDIIGVQQLTDADRQGIMTAVNAALENPFAAVQP